MRAPLSGGFLSFPPGLGTYVVLVALVVVLTPHRLVAHPAPRPETPT